MYYLITMLFIRVCLFVLSLIIDHNQGKIDFEVEITHHFDLDLFLGTIFIAMALVITWLVI